MTGHLPVPTPYTGSEVDNILRIALDIGEGMLKCGAEVHRVEVTIERICRTYGAAHIDVFTIHSLILAAVYMPDGSHSTQSRRIFDSSNYLSKLELYNSLSREICQSKPPISEVDERIRAVKDSRVYPFIRSFFGHVIAAGSFAVFFGGSLRDGVAAAIIGAVVALLNVIRFDYFNKMVKILLISFVAGLLSCISVRVGLGESMAMIAIGTIMLLIPGLSLGNAMRDLLGGDTLTGTLKAVQAVIIALMIAIGYSLAILMVGGGL
ncbi:MAG: threonine/serine exporter family protein [Ruminococcaceae bacterium]|nr:threonine/serine exporter family protein [Oscillospiraceae bacterium]